MSQFLTRRQPSPAMAVAFIALLAALSGTAVALPGKNTVDSGDIKNNALRTQDIRNGSVTTKDVKDNDVGSVDIQNDTLTGIDINEGSLGQVPLAISANTANTANTANSANSATTANSANSANTAHTANTANTANTATNANRAGSAGSVDGRMPFLVKLSAGQSQTLATHGAVSIVAECVEDGGEDVVRILGATSQDGAAMGSNDFESYTGSPTDSLNSTTPAGNRIMSSVRTADGTTNVDDDIDQGWVMALDGKTLGLDGETTPLGLNCAGAECVVSGVVNASG
jgi:hypothetical protein